MSEPFIHESAIVDQGAELAQDVKVWHFVHVCSGARIGEGSSLGQNVFVARGVQVGARVKIQNNVSLYEGVVIADDVFLGPSCVFTNVVNPRSFVQRKHEFRPSHVGQGASIGANATIVCGNRIGAYAFVAAGATVTREVPAYALVVGSPARLKGFMCKCGEKLRGAGVEVRGAAREPVEVTCSACASRYQIEGERCMPVESPADTLRSHAEPRASNLPVPQLDLDAQNRPLFDGYRAAFERVMQGGQFIMGPEVEAFEGELRATFGFKHAITVSSGTDALLLALMALGIGAGDEVITTPFSFFATAGCVARLGAKPVFVDIDPHTLNIDARNVEAAITSRTRAILPVHLFGLAADMSALSAIAAAHKLAIVEDAAQSLGASFAGQQVGTIGQFGCFSFFPSKNLGAFGDAGLLTTEDDALADKARLLRTHGGRPKYFHKVVGGNFRLDALQAALLRVKLPHVARYTEARRANASFYDQQLATLKTQLSTPAASPGHVYNQYVLRTPRRDALRAALTQAGIGTEVYYPRSLHVQECFANLGYQPQDMPESERAVAEVLAIPVYPELNAQQRARVLAAITTFFGG